MGQTREAKTAETAKNNLIDAKRQILEVDHDCHRNIPFLQNYRSSAVFDFHLWKALWVWKDQFAGSCIFKSMAWGGIGAECRYLCLCV